MHSMETKETIILYLNIANRVISEVFLKKKKLLYMIRDVNQSYSGDHFTWYKIH